MAEQAVSDLNNRINYLLSQAAMFHQEIEQLRTSHAKWSEALAETEPPPSAQTKQSEAPDDGGNPSVVL